MTDMLTIRKRQMISTKLSLLTINHIAHSTPYADATTYRDSGDGWTVLEVLCHLRDFELIFHERAAMMRDEDTPALPAYDHEQMAIDRNYNTQDIAAVVDELNAARDQFRSFFKALTPAQWERGGHHPEREGIFTMTDALMQISLHDLVHIEQMTRILREKRTAP